MVNIIPVGGITLTAPSSYDFADLLEGKVARLIAVRTLGKADQPLTLTFTGSGIAQTFAGSAQADHRHNLLIERSNPASGNYSLALQIPADGVLFGQNPGSSSMPTAIQLMGGFTPSGAITTPITPVGTIGAQTVGSLVATDWTIDGNGLLVTGTAAAGHARLVGANRTTIAFGSNLTPAFMLQLQVLYLKAAGGVF